MLKNRWKILWLSCALFSHVSLGNDCRDYQGVIDKCVNYTHTLEDQNSLLKQSLADSRKQTEEATKAYGAAVSKEASLPWYVYVLIGGAVGYVGGRILK